MVEGGAEEAEEGEEDRGVIVEISQKCMHSKGEEISFLLPFESNGRSRVYLDCVLPWS